MTKITATVKGTWDPRVRDAFKVFVCAVFRLTMRLEVETVQLTVDGVPVNK